MLLTQDQLDTFKRALASYNVGGGEPDASADLIESTDEITVTLDTVDDFFRAHGRRLKRDGTRPAVPMEQWNTVCGPLLVWPEVQARKGARRGNLYVMDFGGARAAHFDGEE